jgi:hypothetical protein
LLGRILGFSAALLAAAAFLVAIDALPSRPARALPPGGTDTLDVTGQVEIESRLGHETIALAGTAVIERSEPHLDGGVEVSDLELIDLSLEGESLTGDVLVTESDTLPSTGELRSLQQSGEFPASSYIDAFVQVSTVANPTATVIVHNNMPFHLRPAIGADEQTIDQWPPAGVTYALEPLFGVDNDGDTLIDEDTGDDDHDGLIDEDRPGDDPDSPDRECHVGGLDDPDCDDVEGEDPPAGLCPTAIAGTETLCDADADGLIDEDPSCVPLMNSVDMPLKAGICVRDVRITIDGPVTPTPAVPPSDTPTGTLTPPTATTTPTATPTATATSVPELAGDADCSGRVDAIDAAILLQYVAHLLDLSPCLTLGDADDDGDRDAIDAALVLQFIAGLIAQLPA